MTVLPLGAGDAGVEYLHYDEAEDRFALQKTDDVEPVLDAARRAFNEGLVNKRCEFRRVATFPIAVLEQFGLAHGVSDPAWYLKRGHEDLLRRACNARDLAGFRTLPGRV